MHILVVAGDNYCETYKFSLFSCMFEERLNYVTSCLKICIHITIILPMLR